MLHFQSHTLPTSHTHQMQLVVYGRENLTTLSHWIQHYFSQIPDRTLTPRTYNTTSFPPPFNKRIVYYFPVADSNVVVIYWQLPSMEDNYRNAMSDFITRFLDQEGTGSVLSYLKQNELATWLSSGTELDTDSYSLVYVQIGLTDTGLEQVSEVVMAISCYIRLLRDSSGSENDFQELFHDFTSVHQTLYDYGERVGPKDYIL